MLGDEGAPGEQDDLALLFRTEDAEARLGEALSEATVLLNDRYDTSPREFNPGEPGEG